MHALRIIDARDSHGARVPFQQDISLDSSRIDAQPANYRRRMNRQASPADVFDRAE